MINLLNYFLRGAAPQRRRQFTGLVVLIVFSGFVELAALGCLALFVTSLSAPDAVLQSRVAVWGRRILGPALFADTKVYYAALGSATVTLVLAKNLLTALHNYAAARFDGALNVDYGVRMLDGFLELPYARSSRVNSAEVIQIISWKAHVGTLASSLTTVLSDVVISVLMLGSLFVFEPLVTLAVAVILGSIGLASYRLFRGRVSALGHVILGQSLDVSNLLMKSVQGLKDVKLFHAAGESVERLRSVQDGLVRNLATQRVLERATVWVLETVGMGGLVLGSILLIVSADVSSARMMGTLSLVAVSAWRILPAIYRSVAALGTVRGYMPYLEQVRFFVEDTARLRQRKTGAAPESVPPLSRAIEARSVSFRYEGAPREALSGVDLNIARGEMVGIVGRSGAGKSTLADILTGLLEPTGGELLVDGRALRAGALESWRGQVGFVPQSPYLFEGSLAQNVAFSTDPSGIDRGLAEKSLRSAGLGSFLDGLPQGLDTSIGERGGQLSGGQAQRVAIARALYRNPGLLLFDEATSSLDAENERVVRETIRSLRGGKTIVVIAHRIRTILDCDRVIRLEDGRVADQGLPEAVMARYQEPEGEKPGPCGPQQTGVQDA